MARTAHLLLATTAIGLLAAQPARADDEGDAAQPDKRTDIIVTGIVDHPTPSATGLALTLRETPQSVTIIDRQRIDDFALNNVNDLLDQAVGINVDRTETDRTEYNARGFDITNFQVDGMGLPLRWGIQFGDLDTVLFERVDVVRGANAIMTGIGNPSATINYIRKQPTKEFQASASVSLGTWSQRRLQADVSGPLNSSGTLAARLIFAHDQQDSYLHFNHVNRNVYGAMLSWEIMPHLTASAGYTRQDNDSDGVLWGALPLINSDGSRVNYPVSASTSTDWTHWNVHDQSAWAELAWAGDNGWQARGRFTYNQRRSDATLLYAYGYPDATTGLGVSAVTGNYRSPMEQYLGDFLASGPISLFGREHSLAFGLSTAKQHSQEYEAFSPDTLEYPAVSDWAFNGLDLPQPAYPDPILQEDINDRVTRAFGALHINLIDSLKMVAGASAMWVKTTGDSYAVDQSRSDSKVSPYVGAVFDATQNISLYASYTSIYNPQSEVDVTNHPLSPASGTNIEGGIKSEWLDKRLYVSAALFRARQAGLAEAAGTFGPDDAGPVGKTYYTGVDTTAKGFEIEVTGHLTPNWAISGGYTGLRIRDENGDPTRTFVPTRSLKLATTYVAPELNDLRLGAQFRWQNAVTTIDSGVVYAGVVSDPVTITQDSYGVLDLTAAIRIVDHLRASVNLRNVTNSKYLGSLKWGQAFYAAPRSALFTLSFDY